MKRNIWVCVGGCVDGWMCEKVDGWMGGCRWVDVLMC